ncbi:MAG: hypothetical protein R2713_10315 [Ilumatobacteraceae bacterium]
MPPQRAHQPAERPRAVLIEVQRLAAVIDHHHVVVAQVDGALGSFEGFAGWVAVQTASPTPGRTTTAATDVPASTTSWSVGAHVRARPSARVRAGMSSTMPHPVRSSTTRVGR